MLSTSTSTKQTAVQIPDEQTAATEAVVGTVLKSMCLGLSGGDRYLSNKSLAEKFQGRKMNRK
jgi:hypothetical protein